MKMSISLVVVLGMGIASGTLAEDRGVAQRQVKPIDTNAEMVVTKAKSDGTNSLEPSVDTLIVQLKDIIKNELEAVTDTEVTSIDSLKELNREMTEHFESMIAFMQDGFFSASEATDSSVSWNKTLDIVSVVPTKGGVLAVIDSGDGAVHVFAIAKEPENSGFEDTAGFALHVSITEQGAEVMSIDRDRLAGFVGMRPQNTELAVVTDSVSGEARKLDKEKFSEQLFALSSGNIEGDTIESLQKSAPEVHKFLQSMIVSMDDGILSPGTISQFTDSSPDQGSLDVVSMKGGVLSVLDSGAGVVHLIINAIDHESLNLDEGGFAMDLAINQDGVEIMQMDDSLLSNFLGSGSKRSQLSVTRIVNNPDGDTPQTDIICPPAICDTTKCCCLISGSVGKEAFVCVACVSRSPLDISVDCTKLVIK